MPLQRTPLRDTGGNRRFRGLELFSYQRGEIAGMRRASATLREIELKLGHSRKAVRKTLGMVEVRDKGETLQMPRQKLKYDGRARRRMLYCLHNHLKITYAARRKATGLTMSDDYISELVTTHGLQH